MVRVHTSSLGRIFGRPRQLTETVAPVYAWTAPDGGATRAANPGLPGVSATSPFEQRLPITSFVITNGADRLRLDIDTQRALLFPLDQRPFGAAVVMAALDHLRDLHFVGWVESIALANHEVRAFAQNRFMVRQSLRLLTHDLRRLGRRPSLPPGMIARTIPTIGSPPTPTTADINDILQVDRRAFPDGLALDLMGLRHSLTATPTVHLGSVRSALNLEGFTIAGRVGRIAYLQRLAVDPEAQGHGIGTALVDQTLRWARRHGARRMVVNTQQTNTTALRLYTRLGFESASTDLTVMGLLLGPVTES
jgi:predicted N-acetyltransferase YhbS